MSSRRASRAAPALFFGVRRRRLPHPGPLGVCTPPSGQALRVARAGAFENALELAPIDGPELVALLLLVPTQGGIGHGEPQEVRLRYGEIDEFLAQLVV